MQQIRATILPVVDTAVLQQMVQSVYATIRAKIEFTRLIHLDGPLSLLVTAAPLFRVGVEIEVIQGIN